MNDSERAEAIRQIVDGLTFQIDVFRSGIRALAHESQEPAYVFEMGKALGVLNGAAALIESAQNTIVRAISEHSARSAVEPRNDNNN